MPTGDLNRSIERWIEKERESEGIKQNLFHSGDRGYRLGKM